MGSYYLCFFTKLMNLKLLQKQKFFYSFTHNCAVKKNAIYFNVFIVSYSVFDSLISHYRRI